MQTPAFSLAFQTDKPLTAYGALAAAAEGYGFDALSVYNDLFYQPAWPALFEMARATRRLRLGPAAVNPFTCHPVNLAGYTALLDEASGGRAYLGLARGAWLDRLGMRPGPPSALREALEVIRHLLRGEAGAYHGHHFHLAAGSRLRWAAPRTEVPFLLGTWGPATLRACLDLVQEVKLGGTANPVAVRRYRRLLEQEGRARERVRLVAGSVTVVAEDGPAARARARREVALYLPVVARLDPDLGLGPDLLSRMEAAAAEGDLEAVAGLISDDLLRRVAFAGTPEEVAEQARELVAAGADRVEFGTPHGETPEQGLRLLGEAVLPALRD